MDAGQRDRLLALVRSDPEAASLFRALEGEAVSLVGSKPDPLARIDYEGLLNTDPRRIASVAQLRRLDEVAALHQVWQVSGDARTAEALRGTIAAWAGVYRPTGNDVNEYKLLPLLAAYHDLRPDFPIGERDKVDAWIRTLGKLHSTAARKARPAGNRYTKRLGLLALCGRILGEETWIAEAAAGARRFIETGLHADGTGTDLIERDSLTYHTSALRPVIDIALWTGDHALYEWTSPSGASLKRSVDYVVPFAEGKSTREEWRNSKVDLDRLRAEAGIESYRPGRPYDPKQALPLLEEASVFDPALVPLVLRLHGSGARRFASWPMVVRAALVRPGPTGH